MSRPSASDALKPPAAPLQARFAADLCRLIDPARDRMVVALSGGADSVALLLLAHAALGARCSAATVDHGLRPAAAAEARFAAGLCARLGVAHAVLHGPLPARAAGSANLSARARALRYALLDAHVAATGADWLATAHHADDQRETLVMRLNRGAGVAGLAGVRPRGWRLVRPLLGWRRAALAAIVAAAGIDPVADPSNTDDRYDRARLRRVLDAADWLDPERVAASAAALAEAEEALAWSAQGLAAARIALDDGGATLDPAGVPPELLRRLLAIAARAVDPGCAPRGDALGRALATLAAGGTTTLGGVRIAAAGGRWRLAPAPPRRG